MPKLLLVSAAALLLWSPWVVAQEPPQESSIDGVGQDSAAVAMERLPGLRPEIDAALVSILTAEAKMDELTRPVDAEGKPITDPDVYQEAVFGEDSPFLVYLFDELKRFDLHGTALPSIRFGADLVRFDAGYQAAQALLGVDPDLKPDEVLALFTPEFVEADPIWGKPEAREYHTSELQVGQVAPLGNGGALGFLAWGLLQQSSYWSDPKNDREAFIFGLLVRGFDAPLLASAVWRALQPPMIPPIKEAAKSHPGRGIAGPLDDLRGKVGFTKVHEDRLEADLASLVELKKQPVDSSAPKKYDYLEEWLPAMLNLVRFELYPADNALRMRHGATLLERRAYWQRLFQEYGFVEGRMRFLAEVEAIMAGADEHPNTKRIDELLALKGNAGLTPDEEAELTRLMKERDSDRDKLINFVTGTMALFGANDHYELLLDTLSVDLPAAFGSMPAYHQEEFLNRGWEMLSTQAQPKTMQTLTDCLAGTTDLPIYAVGSLVDSIAIHDYSGREALLTSLAEEGSPRIAGRAIMNSKWASDATFAAATDRLIGFLIEPGDESSDPLTPISIVSNLATGLQYRGNQAKAKAILMKTFEAGLWKDSESPFVRYCHRDNKEWVRGMLSDEDVAKLVKEGKLMPGVF